MYVCVNIFTFLYEVLQLSLNCYRRKTEVKIEFKNPFKNWTHFIRVSWNFFKNLLLHVYENLITSFILVSTSWAWRVKVLKDVSTSLVLLYHDRIHICIYGYLISTHRSLFGMYIPVIYKTFLRFWWFTPFLSEKLYTRVQWTYKCTFLTKPGDGVW